MKLDVLNQFESFIKQYKASYFNKVWEKSDANYKLIYNIQGLVVDNKYYANLKFIFWLNATKTEITEPVVSYLYSQFCDYKSETITDTNITEIVTRILTFIQKEKTNAELSKLIISGTDDFNKELKKQEQTDFIQDLRFVPWKQPGDDKSCVDTKFNFELESNLKVYYFSLKSRKADWLLIYNTEEHEVQFTDIPKKLITLIYATDRNNV